MKRVAIAFCMTLVLPSALWLLASARLMPPNGFFELRDVVIQYSGVIATACMSVAMVLAIRPRWPERLMGGLDKMYRLHKWLGIGTLAVATLHWLWSEGPKWAADLGVLTWPEWGEWPTPANPIEKLFGDWHGWAEFTGEWTFYATAFLIVLALTKRFPYRLFAKTHRLLAVAYLVLAFHAVILFDFASWVSVLGLLVVTMLTLSTVAAVIALLRRVGANRRVAGTILSTHFYAEVRVVEVEVTVPRGWPGHTAGQFAFVTFDPSEGAHPFTIASEWDERNARVTFIIKELGDYTRNLHGKLRTGQTVTIEGPYGRFVFDDDRNHQIWVGGGVGITPFIARMRHRAKEDRQLPMIDLFHCTRDYDPEAIARLTADAEAAGVRLHVLVDGRNGHLNGDKIRALVPHWVEASFWFCGPAGLGRSLRQDLAAHGFPVTRLFHRELFSLR